MGQLGNLSPAASIAIGILVGLLSTSIQSIGLTLQRKSHLLEDSKQDDSLRRPPYRRRRWQLGMLMFVIANLVGSSIQITTLPLPVLSTLQASGLVFNTICASILLGEPFTRWSLGGTSLVAAGALLIALFGALPEPTHSLDSLLVLLRRPAFIAWMVCTFLAIMFTLIGIFLLPRFMHERRPPSRSRSLSRSFTSQTTPASQPHHHRLTPRLRLITGMSLGAVSAVLSAHCLLIAKSAVELLVQTATGSNQFNRFESWLILIALIVFALTQLYFLHKGLKLCSTSVLYPFVFCVYNIIAILDGLIYFNQTDDLPPLHAGLIALGTVILLAGVLALSWRLSDERSQENLAQSNPYPHAHSPTTAELGQQSLLTPGMGMVEDTPTDSETPVSTPGIEADSYHWQDEDSDDEGTPVARRTERTPLLARQGSHDHPARAYNTSSAGSRRARFQMEEDEDALDVWDALMDVGAKELAARDSPSRGTAKRPRRASTLGLLRPQHTSRGQAQDDAASGHRNGNSFLPLTSTPLRRTKTVGPASRRDWSWVPSSPLTSRSWMQRSQRGHSEAGVASAEEARGEQHDEAASPTLPSTKVGLPSWVLGWFRSSRTRRSKARATPETDAEAGQAHGT